MFRVKNLINATKKFEMVRTVYGETSLSRTHVFECHRGYYKNGGNSVEDDLRRDDHVRALPIRMSAAFVNCV